MTDPTMALMEYLRNVGLEPDERFLQEGLKRLTQTVMELEAAEQIGAGRYERTPERRTYRNGHRERVWETRVGEIPLRIPKVRDGTYFPSLLEPRRRSEKALLAVVQQAYVEGVSTRRVDDLLQALGLTGIDKSRVSRICKELDEVVEPFRNRPLEGQYPFVWLDALYLKVRQNHRIVSQALVIATGVRENGEREMLGFALGASEEEAFWLDFLRSLKRRGLTGVQLVTSDAHEGLRKALGQVLAGVTWQRCRVHFMRNLLAHVPRGDMSIVAAALRTIFAQPDRQAAGVQLAEVVQAMQRRWPKAAELLAQAEDDILAYMAFPAELWTRIYSTNPLERLNKEVKRRTNVVGIFPDTGSVMRLVGAVLLEIADEWQVGRRYFSLETMARLIEPQPLMVAEPVSFHLAPVH
ncbi:MAG: IS256 family transposase [Dehalococcoidia bacterium]|nr:IS256 family transposase [Dehalococcoidia bacterium]